MLPSIASSSSAAAAEMMTANNGAFAGSKPFGMMAEAKRESVLIRPLGGGERFFHLYSHAFPVHFSLVARIEGELDSAKLAAALDQVRRRHPALRVCIVDDAESGPAFYRIDDPIEIHAAPAETTTDWRWVVERELSRPFSAFPGPLMRATALWASDGASIILTFHHAIMDALSGTRILRDVMQALAGESLEVLPTLPPVEEMIASFTSGPVVVREGGSLADISSRARATAAQPPDRLMANLAITEWDQEETARVLRSCKTNGTTVHGAICAAASRHLPASDANALRMHCPIDLGRIMRNET